MSAQTASATATEGDDSFYGGVSGTVEYDERRPDNNEPIIPVDPEVQAARENAWRKELAELETEIATLRSVLESKMRESNELKQKLGITTLSEFRDDVKHGIQVIKESETMQKTNAAIKTFGAYASKKFDEMRNSSVFKSVEEKVGTAYTSVKEQISGPGSPSEDPGNFEDALRTDVESKSGEPQPSKYVLTPAAGAADS